MSELEYVTMDLLEAKLQNVVAEDNRQNHRISQLEIGLMKITNVTTSIEKLAVNVEQIAFETKENRTAIKELEGKSGKKWEKVVECAISTVIGGVIGYLMFKLGIGK